MRHYCNKQEPKKIVRENSSNAAEIQNNLLPKDKEKEKKSEKSDDEVVFPPGINYNIYGDTGVKMSNYTPDICESISDYGEARGGSVNQSGGYIRQSVYELEQSGEYIEDCPYISRTDTIFHDNLSGRFELLSIPQNRERPRVLESMLAFLQKYKGKYICMDLWNNDSIRIEKCGYLENVDNGYIVIQNPASDEITMLDLNTIKYISIYCR